MKMSKDELKCILEKHYEWVTTNGFVGSLAYLRGADLSGVDLRGADLRGADLFVPMACPTKGSFTGYKIVTKKGTSEKLIVELRIPAKAKRSSATGRKCRCSEAKVVSISTLDGTPVEAVGVSAHDPSFVYEKGKTVKVKNFDPDRWNECTSGIHFFIDIEEARRCPVFLTKR